VLTIESTARTGFVQVIATYRNLSCSAMVILTTPPLTDVGNIHIVPLTVSDITGYTGKTFTLTYNASVLELVDLCKFTDIKELSQGHIPGTGIWITDVSSGRIVFTVDRGIINGKKLTEVVNAIEFRVKTVGNANINFEFY
jgi:Cft2 family RNA processing exonuclease